MHEDSPPPFIVIRTPAVAEKPAKIDAYQVALDLVGHVHAIVQVAVTRFYLRDKLDRAATGLVFELGRANSIMPASQRWKEYRSAQRHASDAATVIDILTHQKAGPADKLDEASALVRQLQAEITRLVKS